MFFVILGYKDYLAMMWITFILDGMILM